MCIRDSLIDAQVAQADDVIAVRQSLYLLLSDGKHILAGSKAHTLDLGGVGLGSSLRRIPVSYTHLDVYKRQT